jgi:predicted SAM-dependent methyltransferase
MKLHLGCGTKHIEGYINIDIRYLPGVDEVNNVKFLRNYKSNSVTEIYASHVLEHFGRWEYKNVLKRWFEILEPGGVLKLAVPDFESITDYYNRTKDLKSLIGMMYGGQDYDENFHHIIFDFNTLSKDLIEIGFTKTERWDTMEMSIDDYSKSFLPHMDFNNGQLMSLNIFAVK